MNESAGMENKKERGRERKEMRGGRKEGMMMGNDGARACEESQVQRSRLRLEKSSNTFLGRAITIADISTSRRRRRRGWRMKDSKKKKNSNDDR